MRTLAAIMFTDIAGYTALMQQDEQEALAIRNTHRKHFNEITEKYGGNILQYYGDGTLSIFQSAHQAVQCGIELQQAFRQPREIPVRIGIHLGDIIFDEEEIIGDAVNIASRVESLAKPGSVLISEKIYDEIKNQRSAKVKLLGSFQFKNVFRPINVYAVAASGLYVPELSELGGKIQSSVKLYDLPNYPDPFIGREYHIHAVSALLDQSTTRLITLLGPGGMGKTRLSVRLGEVLAGEFEHGVCFVPLDVVTDYRQVPLYIGHRLGVKERFGNSWLDEIIDFLLDKQVLLILDNLEQILESAGTIARILEACSGVKVLATSRELLGLSQEIEYSLDSLNRPNSRLFPAPEDLLKFDAVQLFVQKAKFTAPRFQLDTSNAAAVVGICQELEGLPLPIELAAARVKLFSPEIILNKLKINADLLKTRSRDVTSRHQTMHKTIEWSYDLLDDREQQLFQQLALFRSGFTTESLAAVCPETDVLDVIESFINKSLIVKGKEIHHTARFRMLKLIRDFGLQQLNDNPLKATYYQRFTAYFRSFIEMAQPKLQSAEQARWIALFEAEYENLLVSLEWLNTHQAGVAAEMASLFWRFHVARGFLREGLSMLEYYLDQVIEDKAVEAKLLQGAGTLSHNLGQYTKAKEYFANCLDIWQSLEDKLEIARALNNVGWAEWRIGNYQHTLTHAEKALNIAVELNDLPEQARSLNNRAWALMYQGFFEQVEALQHRILALRIREKNDRGIAFAKTNLGWALLQTGKISRAKQLIEEGIELFERLKATQLIAFSALIKAFYLIEKTDLPTAGELLQENCLPRFKQIGDIWGMASSHQHLGRIFFLQQDPDRAGTHLNKAAELFRDSKDKYGEAATALELSKLSSAGGDERTGGEYLDRSLFLALSIGSNALLRDGYLERAFRDYRKKSMEAAMRDLAVADHYAQLLGTFQYEKFKSQVLAPIAHLRKYFKGKEVDLTLEEAAPSHRENTRLSTPLDQDQLQAQVQKLLASPEYASPDPVVLKEGQASGGVEGTSNEDIEHPFVRQVRRIIEAYLSEPKFGIQILCREMGMSHSHLHRKLSRHTGLSATKFIRSIRLNKARELLLNPERTVAAIAYDTGFRDPDYFYRVFKKTFGMTPKEYRESEQRQRR